MSLENPHNRKLSEEEKVALRDVFNQIDSNSDGRLTKGELLDFMVKTGMDTHFLGATIKVFDHNQDGTLSFTEFLEYLQACQQTESDPRYLFHLIFESVDTNKDKQLSLEELEEFLDLCGQRMTEEQLKNEINSMDTDGNKLINFEELCAVFGI